MVSEKRESHLNIKLWNEWYFVENKTDYAACFKMQYIFLLPKYIKLILGVYFPTVKHKSLKVEIPCFWMVKVK